VHQKEYELLSDVRSFHQIGSHCHHEEFGRLDFLLAGCPFGILLPLQLNVKVRIKLLIIIHQKEYQTLRGLQSESENML
jgi:hypothetical protein